MWAVSPEKCHSVDKGLATISADSPALSQTHEDFALLVGLWCGRIQVPAPRFSVGLLAGELTVDVVDGRISNSERLQLEYAREKISWSKSEQAKGEGKGGGELGFDVGKWLGLRAEVKVGTVLNKTVSKIEQKDGEYFRVVWRVADAGPNLWRVFGIGQNEENVLENKIIGDQPLCRIIADPKSDSTRIHITFRCHPADLSFDFHEAVHPRRDPRFSQGQDLKNRIAVAKCIAIKGLVRQASKISQAHDGEPLALVRQHLRAVRRPTDD